MDIFCCSTVLDTDSHVDTAGGRRGGKSREGKERGVVGRERRGRARGREGEEGVGRGTAPE